MKKSAVAIAGILITFLVSCSKEALEISADNLSSCPVNSVCTYGYTENADLNSFKTSATTGDYRAFWFIQDYKDVCSGTYRAIWVKTPMTGTSFSYDSKDINKELVIYNAGSPCASMIPLKVVGGYVNGVRIDNRPAGDNRWLLDLNVVLGMADTGKPVDTVKVKQYFTRPGLTSLPF